MSAIKWVLTSLRSSSPTSFTLPVIKRSSEQRFIYSALLENKQWRKLSELCIRDIHQSNGDLLGILGYVGDARRLKIYTNRLIEDLKKTVGFVGPVVKNYNADHKKKVFVSEDIKEILNRDILPKNHGRLILTTAAHSVMLLKNAALQNLVQGETNYNNLANNSDIKSEFLMAFWRDPKISDIWVIINTLNQYHDALDRLQKQIYVSTLSDKKDLSKQFNSLIQWVTQNIKNLVHIHSTILLLLENEEIKKDNKITTRLVSLAIDSKVLIREMIASDLACAMSLLSINGITFNSNIPDVISRSGSLPFHGRIHVGKKTDIRRLNRLPNDMLVKVEGILTSVKHLKKKNDVTFVGILKDINSDHSITIVAPYDLFANGLISGSYVRISAFYRKKGSSFYKDEHLEIELLDIKKTYAQDIWKIAFLDLASPYFTIWPGYQHINFVRPSETERGSLSDDIPKSQGHCDDKYQLYLEAAQAFDQADSAVTSAHWACAAAAAAVIGFCLLTPLTAGAAIAACIAALAADAAALNNLNIAYMKLNAAQQKLTYANKVWLDCLYPPTGNGSTGSGGSSGSQWGWDAGEDMPDWVSNWNDTWDDGWEQGGDDSEGSFSEESFPDDSFPDEPSDSDSSLNA